VSLPQDLRDGLLLPAFCAPMFLVSNPALATACCKAGVIGSITANHLRGLDELEAQLAEIRDSLDRHEGEGGGPVAPLAVNVSPNKDDDEFRRNLEACQRHGARIIVTSVGDPTRAALIVRDMGMLHYHDVTSVRFAEKAAKAGVDGMIAIGGGGGGHAGTISHLVLIPKIREMFAGTIVMAGAVSTGAVIRAAEVLGADLAYLGTRFIATKEAGAPQAYRQMIVDAGVTDVTYTADYTGLAASWMKESLRQVGLDPDKLVRPERHGHDHLPEGQKPWKDVWSAGQGAALINDIPSVAELVVRLRSEYAAACAVPAWGTN
jgi:nitronate monooxygenase